MVLNAEENDTYKFGKKAPVDPNAPKRPLSAFFFFGNDQRPALQEEGYSVTEISKMIGSKWGEMSEKQRAPYAAKNKKAKEQYQKAYARYIKTDSYQEHKELLIRWKIHATKKSFKPDPNRPKRPLSAYMIFVNSERAQVQEEQPELKSTELISLVAQRWRDLSDEGKEPFIQQAEKAKKAAQKKMEKYMKTEEYQNYQEEKAEYRKKMLRKRKKLKKEMEPSSSESEEERAPRRKRKRNSSSSERAERKTKKQKKNKKPQRSTKKKKGQRKDSKNLKKGKKKKSDKKSKKSKSKKSKGGRK